MKKLSCIFLAFSLVFTLCCCTQTSTDSTLSSSFDQKNTSNFIETKWFTLKVPEIWNDMYLMEESYNEEQDELRFYISMISKIEYGRALLFYINLHPLLDKTFVQESLESDMVHPIGVLTTDNGNSYFVSYTKASEAACLESELSQFIEFENQIDSCLSSFKVKSDVQFQPWNNNILEELDFTVDTNTPFADCSFSIIGSSFTAFQNSSSDFFHDITDNDYLDYGLNKIDGFTYYLAPNIVVGVVDDKILSVSTSPSSTISVREMINQLNNAELYALFGVTPEIIINSNNSLQYTWLINNCYISINAIGSTDPRHIYNNTAISLIAVTDKRYLSTYN